MGSPRCCCPSSRRSLANSGFLEHQACARAISSPQLMRNSVRTRSRPPPEPVVPDAPARVLPAMPNQSPPRRKHQQRNLPSPLRPVPTSVQLAKNGTTARTGTTVATTAIVQTMTAPATIAPVMIVRAATAKVVARGSSTVPMAREMTMTVVNVNAVVAATVSGTIAIHVARAANLGIPNQRFLKTMSCCQ